VTTLLLCLRVRADVRPISAADAGKLRRTYENGEVFDNVHSSSHASSSFRYDNLLLPDNEDDAKSTVKSTQRLLNDEYTDSLILAKRRKPPEYVGYAVNGDNDGGGLPQTTRSTAPSANSNKTTSKVKGKTNVIRVPADDEFYSYGWKEDEERLWRLACRELDCVGDSACVPDVLRGRQPRCQCPIGTDGHRCERRTLPIVMIVLIFSVHGWSKSKRLPNYR